MRRKFLWVIAVLSAALVLLIIFLPRPAARNGKFVPAAPGFKVPSYKRLGYEFLQRSPFEGGKMWIRTDHRWFLFDLEKKQVLGELIEDWPIFLNGDQTKVLVHSDDPSLGEVFFTSLDKISGGKFRWSNALRGESFRLLDLKTGESVLLGRLYQAQGAGSTWNPSLTFRYGYNWPTVDRSKRNVYICDLETEKVRKVPLKGEPCGWWDDTRILIQTGENDLALYDVQTKRTSTLVSAASIEKVLRDNQLSIEVGEIRPLKNWSTGEAGFYLTDLSKRWKATNAILLKLEAPTGSLRFITNQFKFEWSDHFDATGRYYLYSGREIGQSSSAVFVRDLHDGTTRTLVEDDGDNQFSLPNWYGNEVIYVRSNMLWQISLTNSIPTRLFPPEDF